MPLMGVFRHVVVADSDAKALEVARAAYRTWRHHMAFLWEWGGMEFPIAGIYPDDFDTLQARGMAIAGTPETVRRFVAASVAATGITYFVADLVFGSIPFDAATRSIELFAREVMPKFRS
jgi:alkanesulfonate monooxygenase SsuD/methylene tetrahydromethanopterin reductase-like flavin-dependent oxidoreductase (luciferase family)